MMAATSRYKLLTYWVVSGEENQDPSPLSPLSPPQPSGRLFPRCTALSLLAAAALILCGLFTTLWVWTRFGTSGFPHAVTGSGSAATGRGSAATGSGARPGLALLLLGPAVTLVGAACAVTACVLHEARQRRKVELQRRAYQVLYDAMTISDDV